MHIKLGHILISIVIICAIGYIAADQLYIVSFETKFKEHEKERIVTSNKLASAKIVYSNLNHVRDLVQKNTDFPGQKDTVTPESVYFDFLTSSLNDLKMKIISVRILPPSTVGLITTYGYDIELEGDFFKFGELCSKFENSRRIISIESFKIEHIKQSSEGDKVAIPANAVHISLRVYTYRVRKGSST
jgi:Tfp pilus assembly protein PilO